MLALHQCRAITTFKRALPAILLSLIPSDFFCLLEFEDCQKTERVGVVSVGDPAPSIKPVLTHYRAGTLQRVLRKFL